VNDFPEGWDEWLAFLSSHLPEPVRQDDSPDGATHFRGGSPPEVAVRLSHRAISVFEISGEPRPPGVPSVRPRLVGTLLWRRLAPAQAMGVIAALIDAARQNRLAAYRRCVVCDALVAPELMHDLEVCLDCDRNPLPRT